MPTKKIILGLPRSFDFYKLIVENLEFHDFEVIDISYDEHNFKFKNIFDKFKNGFYKLVLKDYDNKSNLKITSSKDNIISKLNSINGKVDLALIIRSDIYPIEIIKKIKEKTNKLVGYQWDGLHRFPGIYKHLTFYDKFYVFDKKDIVNDKTSLLHNFYFDNITNKDEKQLQDLFYIGTFKKDRLNIINSILKELECLNLNYKVHLLTKKSIENKNSDILLNNIPVDYYTYLQILKSSKICLDFLNTTHNGLSFRIFEALCYDKKLITNNKDVINYDFYHPNNIFILDGNLNELKEFLKKPYTKIDEKIKLKYGFKNWIYTILNN